MRAMQAKEEAEPQERFRLLRWRLFSYIMVFEGKGIGQAEVSVSFVGDYFLIEN